MDVYILHMDADSADEDNAARASQIDQLMAAVEANDNGNPVIIMGDTNCPLHPATPWRKDHPGGRLLRSLGST